MTLNRRQICAAAFAATLVPMSAFAEGFSDYSPGDIEDALERGETVLVDYSASWCSTCKRQERVINALRAQDPAFDASLTFIKVDWDTYGRHAVATARNIPRRSTLIVLRGDEELGRIVAGTGTGEIRALMERGL